MVQTTINTNQKSKSLPYPKLMISNYLGTIVLFKDRSIGVVLLEGFSPYKIGHHSFSWDMNNFSDYYEAITLQNEIL